jgi:hypothetical protein
MKEKPLLPQHSRYDYVPLTERKDYSWPRGMRLALALTTNIEWFAFGAGLGHDPAKTGEPQTHRNYSWRDYGNRIGVWRLFELFDELKLPAAHNANSLLYDYAPQIMDAIRKRGDEVVGHGRTNAENLRGLWQPDEERILREVTETIARHEGAPPAGWLGTGAYETPNTPDLLKELCHKYLADRQWTTSRCGCARARPSGFRPTSPPRAGRHPRKQDASDLRHGRRQFDEMIEQSERHSPVMSVSVHTHVSPAVPCALGSACSTVPSTRALPVWWTRPCRDCKPCASHPSLIPGST